MSRSASIGTERHLGAFGTRLLLLAVSLTILTGAVVACSGDDDAAPPDTADGSVTTTTVAGITEEEALAVAIERAESDDPELDLELTRPVIIPDADVYDVSFPEKDPVGRGGEPHVVVDRATAEVLETYKTR